MRGSGSAKAEANAATGDFAGGIKLCLLEEPAVIEGVARLLHQEQENRERRLSCDLDAAIVEVLWTKLQDRKAGANPWWRVWRNWKHYSVTNKEEKCQPRNVGWASANRKSICRI